MPVQHRVARASPRAEQCSPNVPYNIAQLHFGKEHTATLALTLLGSLLLGSRSIFVSISCGKGSRPNDRGKHDQCPCRNPYLLLMDAQGFTSEAIPSFQSFACTW